MNETTKPLDVVKNKGEQAIMADKTVIDDKGSTPDVVVDKKYTIQGSIFKQTELTISEDIKIIKLFKSSLGLDGDAQGTILDAISDMDTIEKFFRIILKGDHDQINFKQLKNSEVEEVMSDFFLLNKSMIQKFMSLGLFFQNPNQKPKK